MKSEFNFVRTFFFLLLVFFVFNSNAQQGESDSTSIEKAVENYVLGWRTADTNLLNQAFDLEAGIVLWVDRKENLEKLKSMKLSELIDNVKPHKDYGIGYEIQSLEIIDSQLAVALIKIPRGDSHYIDCLELQKINGNWKIVLKSFVYFRKG